VSNTLKLPKNTPRIGSSLADLLDELGVSADRVLRYPHPGTATEADFLDANERLDICCELIDGTLVEKAMGSYESLIGGYLISLLWAFVRPKGLGIVLAPDGMFRLFDGNIRMPDVSFIPKTQFPNGLPKGPIWNIVPSLVVEVLSASNTKKEIDRKRGEFFAQGVSLIWVIDPVPRTVAVFEAGHPTEGKIAADSLDGGNALPGFSVQLADLFSVMDL
jgi:Uma2 family endonuclease